EATDDETLKQDDETLKAEEEKRKAEEEKRKAEEEKRQADIKLLKKKAREDDPKPNSSLTLSKIIGGDILSTEMVRSQVWLFLLIVFFTIIYVAIRYQCQRDFLKIEELKQELLDAKYKALSSSSELTERCRESHVLDILRTNKDSVLHIADQPPFIVTVPE
ncbi:MAG: FtsL-like putative cell division protein, partial [Prevotella sp.]